MTTYTSRADAMAAGASTYSNGQPCKRGHIAPRYTLTSVCAECQRQHAKETRRRDRQRFQKAVENRNASAEG